MNAQAIIEAITKVVAKAAAVAASGALGETAQGVGDAVQSAVRIEEAAEPFAKLIYQHVVGKKAVTAADLSALDAGLAALSARIQAPIPPEQPDDT